MVSGCFAKRISGWRDSNPLTPHLRFGAGVRFLSVGHRLAVGVLRPEGVFAFMQMTV